MKATALAATMLVVGLLPLDAHAQLSPLQKRMRDRPSQTTHLMKAVATNPPASRFAVETISRSYWHESGWTLESETRNTFAADRRTESTQYDVTGPTPVPQYRTTYDPHGNVLTLDQWNADSKTYIPYERYTYTLVVDPVRNRFLTEQMIREVWSGAWENAERHTFTLTSDGAGGLLLAGGMTEYWEATAWRQSTRFTLSEVGGNVVEASQSRLGTQWIDSERTTYHNQTIAGLYDLLVDLSAEFEYLFDLNLSFLRLPDFTQEFWTGTRWTNIYRQFADAHHAPTGRPASVRYQQWFGTTWLDESRQEITYKETGGEYRPSTTTLVVFDQGRELTFLSETYSYDGSGLMVFAEQQLDYGFGLENYLRVAYAWRALSVGSEEIPALSATHRLEPAYPNPFVESTTIAYHLATSEDVRVRIFDVVGREVATLATGMRAAGTHRVVLDGASLSNGLYVIRMDTRAGVRSGTAVLAR